MKTKPLVLIICTGNVCRSPVAEYLFRSELPDLPIEFASAGTDAMPDQEIDPKMAALLARRGIETSDFRSRWLTGAMPLSADLILTAATTHRATVTRISPPLLHRTLTLKQLARYAPEILTERPPADFGARIEWIIGSLPRARSRSLREGSDSIEDPIGKSQRTYATVFTDVERSVLAISELLRAR